jgi:hypothetical protein
MNFIFRRLLLPLGTLPRCYGTAGKRLESGYLTYAQGLEGW